MIETGRLTKGMVAALVCAATLCGLASARAGVLAAPPADLSVAAPNSGAVAAPKTAATVAAKKARKARAAALKPDPARAAGSSPSAPEKPAAAPKASADAEGPVSLVGKWNGTNEPDYGPATALRGINQSIDSNLLGGSSQPVGAGAEVGVKYKF